MAEFNFDGLLGNLFGGGGDSELEKLLTAKQKEQLGLQSTLAAYWSRPSSRLCPASWPRCL
jgi:hypothetical protein